MEYVVLIKVVDEDGVEWEIAATTGTKAHRTVNGQRVTSPITALLAEGKVLSIREFKVVLP